MNRMPTGPVQTLAAWKGSDLQSQPDKWLYTLSNDDIDELRGAVETLRSRQLPLERVASRDFTLPTFGPKLSRFAREISEGLGFVLLRGFPTSDLSIDDICLMFFGCMTHIGLPVAQNSKNDLVDHVRKEEDPSEAPRGYRHNRAQGYHSDHADLVSLFCLNPAKSGGISRIMSAVTVHNIIMDERSDLLEVLYEEPFYYSWVTEEPEGQLPYYWTHFYSWYGGRLHNQGVTDLARQAQEKYPDCPRMTRRQQEALDFVDFIQQSRESELALDMDFQPGDVQILDNSYVWHGRTAFEDFEEPDRWRHLLRMWLNYYVERPVAPDFWNRYALVGQESSSPKRRLFDVEIYDTW